MPSKKKPAQIKDVQVYEEDAWYVRYTGTHGKKNVMRLDAQTYTDAKFEASHLLDIPEDKIEG